jgi:hypothetical protein
VLVAKLVERVLEHVTSAVKRRIVQQQDIGVAEVTESRVWEPRVKEDTGNI